MTYANDWLCIDGVYPQGVNFPGRYDCIGCARVDQRIQRYGGGYRNSVPRKNIHKDITDAYLNCQPRSRLVKLVWCYSLFEHFTLNTPDDGHSLFL